MKKMLFDMYAELEVTKDEALNIANRIDNGKLHEFYDCSYGTETEKGCLIGLVDIVRDTPGEHLDMIMTDYAPLEHMLFDKNRNDEEIAQWVREYAEMC